MTTVRKKYDEPFKKNAVKLSYASGKSVAQVLYWLIIRRRG